MDKFHVDSGQKVHVIFRKLHSAKNWFETLKERIYGIAKTTYTKCENRETFKFWQTTLL